MSWDGSIVNLLIDGTSQCNLSHASTLIGDVQFQANATDWFHANDQRNHGTLDHIKVTTTSGPVLGWELNGGGISVSDFSGAGHNGTIAGDPQPTWIAGQ